MAQSWTAYAVRKIRLTMTLGKTAGNNTIVVGTGAGSTISAEPDSLRIQANISKVVAPSTAYAIIRIYGLTLDHINQFTAAGTQWGNSLQNFVMLEAGDNLTGMTVVFNGVIEEAYPDFSNQPDVAFVVVAHAGVGLKLTPVTPTSIPGSADAATVFQQIAQKGGVQLEDSGVKGKLDNPYFPGTAWNQAILAGKALNAVVYYDDLLDVVAVWPMKGRRTSTGDRFIVSADTGMIGYPSFQQNRAIFRCLFDPQVKQGETVTARTQFTAANADSWFVYQLDYVLSSETPDGPWEMVLHCTKDGYAGG